jgi:hypothetical protein
VRHDAVSPLMPAASSIASWRVARVRLEGCGSCGCRSAILSRWSQDGGGFLIETSRERRGIYRRAWLGLGARVLARREIGWRRRFPCSGRSRGDDDLV